jgi:hypothetical protein
VADSRGPFDTVSGVYGGNEFSPLSAEGKRTFAGDAPDKKPAAAPAAAPTPAATPVVVASAAAPPAAAASAAPPRAAITIDPNAFGAVFTGVSGSVYPTAEQLMQLDSLSVIAAEPLRTDLQQKILACRRAGDSCRLAAH